VAFKEGRKGSGLSPPDPETPDITGSPLLPSLAQQKYIRKNAVLLYKAIYIVRENLGDSRLLTRKHDFYQLEGEVWTDLGEMENLIRLAEASQTPEEKEELPSRTRELARGELLPEFPYDPYIDEYRQYYERLKKRVFGS